MAVYPKYQELQFTGDNLAAFQGWFPGLNVSPVGTGNMLCSKDGGETILEPGDYVIKRPGEIHYVTAVDFVTWWSTA